MVFLALGSNINPRKDYLKKAILLIEAEVGKAVTKSYVYETKSWGYDDNDYLNMVISVKTELSPQKLLSKTKNIEKQLGRKSKSTLNISGKPQYEKREIDIDILLYDKITVCAKNLTIPHPLLHERNFVLAPLNDIAPDLIHQIYNKTITELYKECEDNTKIVKTDILL